MSPAPRPRVSLRAPSASPARYRSPVASSWPGAGPAAQHRIEERTAESGRRTEEERLSTRCDARWCLARARSPRPDSRTEQVEMIEMPLTVVFHGVAPTHHLTREFRVPLVRARRYRRRSPWRRARRGGRALCGVIRGSGPSSIVMASSRRAAAAAGSRVQLGPSSALRGVSPRAVSRAWSAITAPTAQGHADGRARTRARAPTCSPSDACTSGEGRQRWGVGEGGAWDVIGEL